jgi:hypothetical protein
MSSLVAKIWDVLKYTKKDNFTLDGSIYTMINAGKWVLLGVDRQIYAILKTVRNLTHISYKLIVLAEYSDSGFLGGT